MRSFLIMTLLLVGSCFGQSWSGIIAPSRAVDWQRANVGVPGGIPTNYTQCGSTVAAGTSLATINADITACGANTYLLLGTGTFNLAGSIAILGKSNIILRGSGPNSTILNFTADGIGGSFSGSIYAGTGSGSTPTQTYTGSASTQPGGANACTWTGGFSKGATSITLTTCGSTGILNGDVIFLDQKNDLNDTGGYMVCDNGGTGLSPEGGITFACMVTTVPAGNTGRVIGGVPYAQIQPVVVTAGCASACNGAGPYTLTISPGLYANNWNQGAGAGNTGAWFVKPVSNVGIENLTVDDTNCPNDIGCNSGIQFFNVYGGWTKNVRVLNTRRNHIMLTQDDRMEIRDSYFYGTKNSASQSYGVETYPSSDTLIENNISQALTTPVMSGGGAGNVIGYNFSIDNIVTPSTFLQGTYPSHTDGDYMNLWEGNIMNAYLTDQLHGTSGLITIYRNWLNGLDWNTLSAPANHPTNQAQPITWSSYTRGMNVIGNVLGTPGFHTNYELATPTASSCSSPSIFVLGYSNICGASGGVADDVRVKSSLMRWGNYDTANAT